MEKQLLKRGLDNEALTVPAAVFDALYIDAFVTGMDLAAMAGQVAGAEAWLAGNYRQPSAVEAAEEYRRRFGILLSPHAGRICFFARGWRDEVRRLSAREHELEVVAE